MRGAAPLLLAFCWASVGPATRTAEGFAPDARHSLRRHARPHRSARGPPRATPPAADAESLGLTAPLAKMVEALRTVTDEKTRYKQLLFLAQQSPPMGAELQVAENKVPGCLSTVYVHATLDGEGKVTFLGDSDAQLTKGLVALLVRGLSGCTAAEIGAVQPEFIRHAGLAASLTPG